MNTRHPARWFWPALFVVFLILLFFAHRAATQSQDAAANVKTAGGLTVVTFTVKLGTITVNLPDDMRAGDTISGTVVAEPKGNTKEERAANQSEIKKMGIRLFSRTEETPEDVSLGDLSTVFKYALINDRETGNVLSCGLLVNAKTISKVTVPVFPMTPSGAVITPDPKITVPTTSSGAVITPDPKITTPPGMTQSGAVITPDPKITVPTTSSGAVITPDPKITTLPGMTPSGAVITPDPKIAPTFIIPPLGQTGRPIVITGPFDGNSSNTILNWTRARSAVQDFEKDTENVSGGFGLLAESPRKAVFQAPSNVAGPIELHLTEGKTQTTGNYRSVKVNLTAPKTSLLKGESTELHVEVNGLQGLTQPVPLTLESHGVITMVGGNYQPLVIQPSQVGPDGRFTTTRGITGVQTGGWTATGTVVTHKFDFCLQDDSSPQTVILINTFTGVYIFTPSGGTSLSGQGTVTRKGCTITLIDNPPDRRVQSTLDPCTQTGSASVQTSPPSKPKVKFTITDRNMTDNTCSCGPGCK